MSRYVMEDAPEDRYVLEDAAAVKTGNALNDIPRQLGLTARYGLEGLANTAQIVTEPLRYLQDKITPDRAEGTPKSMPMGALASQFADYIGLPKPQGANERVIGDATRLMAGAGGMGALAGAPVQVGRFGGSLLNAPNILSQNMGQQVASAAGAGLAGGASREAGGNPLMQTGVALVGGVAGGLAPGAVGSAVTGVKGMLNRMTPQQMDTQISAVLNRAGVDYSQVPERARQAMRAEMASALQAGRELDPAAVARLADFSAVGAVPTRGMVSQNPVQITREMNLAKIGANSSDESLQGLPLIQNRNNATLIQNLNDAGAVRGDPFKAGEAAIGGIKSRDASLKSGVDALYQQARDSNGRSLPLDGAAFANRANDALRENLAPKLGAEVDGVLNDIATGKTPLTVEYAEQLKTMLGRKAAAAKSTQGDLAYAYGLVRKALDDTPLMPSPQVNPGNLPAVPGTVPPSATVVGKESIDAFNAARDASKRRFAWQESGKPIDAALNGAQPDKFVQQFVIGGSLEDAKAIANNAPIDEVKNAILAHLKEKALGAGVADEIGKFSQSNFNRALGQIGDRKMALFFSPEEIAQIKSVARVASYMQNQPVGSAVNNSNSGALLLGKGYDALKGVAGKLPFGQSLVLDPIKNIEISMRNRSAQNVLPGLLAQQQRQPMGQGLLLPGLAYGGLLAAPTTP